MRNIADSLSYCGIEMLGYHVYDLILAILLALSESILFLRVSAVCGMKAFFFSLAVASYLSIECMSFDILYTSILHYLPFVCTLTPNHYNLK